MMCFGQRTLYTSFLMGVLLSFVGMTNDIGKKYKISMTDTNNPWEELRGEKTPITNNARKTA